MFRPVSQFNLFDFAQILCVNGIRCHNFKLKKKMAQLSYWPGLNTEKLHKIYFMNDEIILFKIAKFVNTKRLNDISLLGKDKL